MTNELAIRILTGNVLGTTEQTQEAVTMAVRALSQPDATDINVATKDGDMVYRQDAIDALRDEFKRTPTNAIRAMDTLKGLPSAKPEIIRCKDCRWADEYNHCDKTVWWNDANDFCSRPKRREE